MLPNIRHLLMWGEKYVVLWGSYVLKQGNPLQFLKSLIKLYFYCLLLHIFHYLIKEVIKGNTSVYVVCKICRPLRQLQPETGESLDFFESTNFFSCLLFYVFHCLIKTFIKIKTLVYLREKIFSAFEADTA